MADFVLEQATDIEILQESTRLEAEAALIRETRKTLKLELVAREDAAFAAEKARLDADPETASRNYPHGDVGAHVITAPE